MSNAAAWLLVLFLSVGCLQCHALAQARVVVTITDFFNDDGADLEGKACDISSPLNLHNKCDPYFKCCLAHTMLVQCTSCMGWLCFSSHVCLSYSRDAVNGENARDCDLSNGRLSGAWLETNTFQPNYAFVLDVSEPLPLTLSIRLEVWDYDEGPTSTYNSDDYVQWFVASLQGGSVPTNLTTIDTRQGTYVLVSFSFVCRPRLTIRQWRSQLFLRWTWHIKYPL